MGADAAALRPRPHQPLSAGRRGRLDRRRLRAEQGRRARHLGDADPHAACRAPGAPGGRHAFPPRPYGPRAMAADALPGGRTLDEPFGVALVAFRLRRARTQHGGDAPLLAAQRHGDIDRGRHARARQFLRPERGPASHRLPPHPARRPHLHRRARVAGDHRLRPFAGACLPRLPRVEAADLRRPGAAAHHDQRVRAFRRTRRRPAAALPGQHPRLCPPARRHLHALQPRPPVLRPA